MKHTIARHGQTSLYLSRYLSVGTMTVVRAAAEMIAFFCGCGYGYGFGDGSAFQGSSDMPPP